MQKIIEIFCAIDDFCKEFEKYCNENIKYLPTVEKKKVKKISFCHSKRLGLSEVMSIVVYFHLSGYRTFKDYYTKYVIPHMKEYFPRLVSYNRFVELMQEAFFPLLVYAQRHSLGECTGITFIDSTTLDVCENKRIPSHKVFEGLASRGKSSMGWFYGFKLHITINECGDILSFYLTTGSTSDKNENVIDILTKNLYGKLFGDKGYISAKIFKKLFDKGIHLFTTIKKNMKNKLMLLEDRILLRKRFLIESVNDFLKNVCQIEHSRHRSFLNFCSNLFSGIIAYAFLPSRPSIFSHPLDLLPA